ncbi:MAG: hypothetical protein KC656_02160 [Myxococcales bacterium]|nr:hypothetical protein [Myxococcales bacterium]
MPPTAHRPISDADWNQLMTLAAGYLVLEDGNVKAAMARALAAHTELIRALKAEAISAEVSQGVVTMFVPEEGGVALRMEKRRPEPPARPVEDPPSLPPRVLAEDDEPTVPIGSVIKAAGTEAPTTSTFYMDEDEAE